MTCPQCGRDFVPRDRWQRCCSKACGKQAWNAKHGQHRSGGRDMTITFTDADGAQITKRGQGRTPRLAREDAVSQLPAGFVPVSSYTSTVQTILRSLERSA